MCESTALSFQLGHRVSVDSDFTIETNFDIGKLTCHLQHLLPLITDIHKDTHRFFLKVNGIKVDFFTCKSCLFTTLTMKIIGNC